mgnify:FL=1
MSEDEIIHLMQSHYNLNEKYQKLKQDNQQLKEDKNQLEAKLGEANDIIDIEMELRDFWITKYHEVRQVLDEIREYIKYNATSNYFDADTNMFRREVDILQILDKVKE